MTKGFHFFAGGLATLMIASFWLGTVGMGAGAATALAPLGLQVRSCRMCAG